MVIKESRGRVNYYSYNLRNPSARYLKVFFNLSELGGLFRRLKEASDKVVLFGSSADGSDSRQSDMDILVVSRNREAVEREVMEARGTFERKISPVILTHLEWSKLKDKDRAFYDQVSRGIVVWQKEEE